MYDGSDNLLMRFEYAAGRTPVAMTKGGQRYYLAYDQVGTLRAVTDASGNTVKRIDYDTFGNVISDSNTAFAVPFGFAGGLYDADTGLVRFGFRDYDPDTGRWTAKDPILFAGGDTDLYGYCLSDPVNWIDLFGLDVTVVLYPGAGGFGHMGLGVNSPETVGFYPNSGGPGLVANMSVPGIMKPDMKFPQEKLVIPATPEQDRIVQNYIKTRIENPGSYNLYSRNCATTVQGALDEAGLGGNIPKIRRPRKLMKLLQGMYLK